MVTRRQIEANRANAKKSTGPKTQRGKDRSRLNALRHGMTAKSVVIGEENPDDFEELREALLAEYDPQTPTEFELAVSLAGSYWRLRRLPFFEAAIFAAREAQVEMEVLEEDAAQGCRDLGCEEGSGGGDMPEAQRLLRVGRALLKDSVWGDALGKLDRHEASLVNALRRTHKLLDEVSGGRSKKPPAATLTVVAEAA